MKKLFRKELWQYKNVFSKKQFSLIWNYINSELVTIDWKQHTKKHIQEKLYAQFNAINEELFLEEWNKVVNNGWSEKAYDLYPTNIKKLFESILPKYSPVSSDINITQLKLIRHDKRDSFLEHTVSKNNLHKDKWSFIYFFHIEKENKNKIIFADIHKEILLLSNSIFLIQDGYLLDYMIQHHGENYLYYIKGSFTNKWK